MGNNKREKGCSFKILVRKCFTKKVAFEDFPGSPVVKNPPRNVGVVGSIPVFVRHNEGACASQQRSCVLQLRSDVAK